MIKNKEELYKLCLEYLRENTFSKLYVETFLDIASENYDSYDEIYDEFKQVTTEAKKAFYQNTFDGISLDITYSEYIRKGDKNEKIFCE